MNQQTDEKFDRFFAWIYNCNKNIIGAGFFIGRKEIATCAHVVRVALGLQATPASAPKDDVILSFPFLKHDTSAADILLSADVLAEGWDKEKDIAILRLNDDLPEKARPAKLSSGKVKNHSFSVYGFPGKTDKGVSAYGVIKDKREHGLVQLESKWLEGYAVQGGFSGGPVFDDELKKVVGMIITSDKRVRVASMIPVDMLTSVCSRAGINFELEEEVDRAMNISPREICEKCLKESFTARDKDKFISLCMSNIRAVGRELDDMRSIDWMINTVLDYCSSQNNYNLIWDMIRVSHPKQYDKFYTEWKNTLCCNR